MSATAIASVPAMRVDLCTIQLYMRGTCPLIGIPHTPGSAPTAILRKHVNAALSCPRINGASISLDTGDLTLSGKNAQYILYNQNRMQGRLQLRELQAKWAKALKASLTGKARYGKNAAKAKRIETRIRRIRKHHRKPEFTLLEYVRASELETWDRMNLQRWAIERPMRKKLAQIAFAGKLRGETWKQFYGRVSGVLGRTHTETHSKVCNRKHGPDVEDYFKYIYKHCGLMAEKPCLYGAELGSEHHQSERHQYLSDRTKYQAELEELEQLKVTLAGYVLPKEAAKLGTLEETK